MTDCERRYRSQCAGDGDGVGVGRTPPKSTLGAWREPSLAAKYASLRWKPAMPAQKLVGNWPMNV